MEPDTVIWKNNDWPKVQIEIRRGNNEPAINNPLIASPVIAEGHTHTETSEGEDFYWLRIDPPSDGAYIHRPCYGNGETYEEDIL